MANGIRPQDLYDILDEERDELVYKGALHLGIAVATDGGLIVPVIRDVGRLDLAAIAEALGARGVDDPSDARVGIKALERAKKRRGAQDVAERVLDRWDHRHLNTDVEEFRSAIPTSENLALEAGRRGEAGCHQRANARRVLRNRWLVLS